jgi:uncharacterized protein with GYD domain
MPTYLLLATYEQPGLDSRSVMSQAEESKPLLDKVGIKMINHWAALSPYEHVALVEADDDVVIQNTVLWAKQAYGQRTTVVRLFTPSEAERFIPMS